jgi:HAD superfamily hydrolase (TIGR01509 family)
MSQCLLFDSDGTLVDSERLCHVGMVVMFKRLGVNLDADELLLRFRGWKLIKTLSVLEQEYELSLPEDFVSHYRSVVSDLFETELKPVENIEYALKHLPQPKAIVTNGPAHKVEHALRVCGLTDYFGSNIYSAYNMNIWKPDPGIYQFAAKDMGFAAGNCIVVEDSPVGVEAGHKAGMKTMFYNRFEEECEFSAVTSFQAMEELPELIRMHQKN